MKTGKFPGMEDIPSELISNGVEGTPCRPVHPPYSSVFVTEFNPEYGNTDLLIWLRKRSSPKYGNGHHLNIFFTVIYCVKMWRHLLEMCMFLFIMLDARPRAIYLRPRNLY